MGKARARLERWTNSLYYTVIDTHTNKIVICTTSYGVADYWRDRVNGCEHPLHYDVVEHDSIVERWVRQGRENGKSI